VIRKNQKWINALNILSDGALLLFAFFLAAWFRFEIWEGSMSASEFVHTQSYLVPAAAYAVGMVFAYYLLQMYGSYRFKQIAQEIVTVCAANAGGVLVLMAVLFLLRLTEFSRGALALLYLFSDILVLGKRIGLRRMLRHYRMLGYNLKHVVIVGNGHLARQYLDDIKQGNQYGLVSDGYVSCHSKADLGTQLGAYEELEQILEKTQADDVVIALEPHEVQWMPTILSACEKEGVRTSIIPYYNDYLPAHPQVETIGESKLMNIRTIPLDNLGNAMAKRLFDIVVSAVLIVLTSPIMLAVAIGVKLSSPGPVLFKQERVGLDKKSFKMLKFRSMRIDTAHDGWTTDDDPRKTKFGSFIRKCSLDEFPQFFNVLKGDMSLIGPRPELPHFVEQFKEKIPLYLVRQQVRPGITGWAQVNGLRGDTSIVERVKYDIWYIENWTWLLDMKILWKTAFGGMVNSEKIAQKGAQHEKAV
jgi:Undecaprenyl-phosphate glucose phosphotransferase